MSKESERVMSEKEGRLSEYVKKADKRGVELTGFLQHSYIGSPCSNFDAHAPCGNNTCLIRFSANESRPYVDYINKKMTCYTSPKRKHGSRCAE